MDSTWRRLGWCDCGAFVLLVAAALVPWRAGDRAELMLDNEVQVQRRLAEVEVLVRRAEGRVRTPDLQRLWPDEWDKASRTVLLHGYRFAVWHPRRGGGATQELASRDGSADAKEFVLLAWPEQHGVTGRRLFAMHGPQRFAVENLTDPCEGVVDMPPAVILGPRLQKFWGPVPAWAGKLAWRAVRD